METEQEIADREAKEALAKLELDKVELDEDGNPVAVEEPELDEDGNPIPVVKELEPWQVTGEDADDKGLPDVAVGTHIKMKDKLKGRIKDRDKELDRLKEENAALKSGAKSAPTELPARPQAVDYDTDELHEEALEDWRDQKADIRAAGRDNNRTSAEVNRQNRERVSQAVEDHYDRSAKLVESSGSSAELFKDADTAFRQAVEKVIPKSGDSLTDYIISIIGDGSEKVIQFIGRNKVARAEFQNLLIEDPDGNKAMVYLGQQKERLTNPKKITSNAVKPAKTAQGDANVSQSGTALKKKYDAAKSPQAAYDIKKQAKQAKVDVSSW